MPVWNSLRGFFFTAVFLICGTLALAQTDTTQKMSMDSILRNQKGIIGDLAKNFLKDTTGKEEDLLRTDRLFQPYAGKIIRHIKIQTLKFGVSIADTTVNSGGDLKNLKKLANDLHWQTRDGIIRNYVFFSENEKLIPSLLADNERHFRNLPFLQDARIIITPVANTDSVDITVLTKDVLSLGGSLVILNSESASFSVGEDDLLGLGDRLEFSGLYDMKRERPFGSGIEYIRRNIGGSFIDVTAGYSSFNRTLNNGKRQEHAGYLQLAKPLVTRYTKWTYGSAFELHETKNFYSTDSLYSQELKYKYYILDAWGTWNIDADKLDVDSRNIHTRRLLGLRVFQQDFSDKPLKYTSEYFYQYADVFAILASASLFRQTFYKTKYIYGFGRNEDVPDGLEASLTAGWTIRNNRQRPYTGFSIQRYYFNKGDHYFNYALKAGGYFFRDKLEDINILASLDYFSCLNRINERWTQRFFVDASATKQVNTLLNEPLKLESEYGLKELENKELFGDFRFTLKAESVFYSPWSLLLFRFAPFVFAHASYFNRVGPENNGPKLYPALGGGVRTRNESLVFSTIEFRGMYFPANNFQKTNWGFEIRTNIRFKYNQNFIRKPEFTTVN